MDAIVRHDFWSHPKARACSLEAKALWLCGLLWAVKHHTDEVPAHVIQAEHPEAEQIAAELLDAGLWTYADSGYRIHDFYAIYPRADRRRELADAVRRGAGIDARHFDWTYGNQLTPQMLASDVTPDEIEGITRWLIQTWAQGDRPISGLPKFQTILNSRTAFALQAHRPRNKADIFKEIALGHLRKRGDSGPAVHRLAQTGD